MIDIYYCIPGSVVDIFNIVEDYTPFLTVYQLCICVDLVKGDASKSIQGARRFPPLACSIITYPSYPDPFLWVLSNTYSARLKEPLLYTALSLIQVFGFIHQITGKGLAFI